MYLREIPDPMVQWCNNC